MKRLLLMLLLLVPFSSALECEGEELSVLIGDQGGNIGAVLMLTAVVTAIAYMLGKVTGNPRFIIFSKDEIYHLAFSVLLLVGFSGLLVLSCNTMDFFFMNTLGELAEEGDLRCYSDFTTIDTISQCYLNSAASRGESISEYYIQQYVDNIMWSTLSMSIALPLFDAYTAVVASYKRVVSNQYDTILNTFLIPAVASLRMQQLLLGFINHNIIAWVMPSAFLLRMFIPTRSMGNVLIALAIGVYILVPYLYTFNLAMVDVALTTEDCYREVNATFLGEPLHIYDAVCDSVVDGYACWDYADDDIVEDRERACTNNYGFWMVAWLVPQAFLLPNLTIALIVTFIGSVARALRVIG